MKKLLLSVGLSLAAAVNLSAASPKVSISGMSDGTSDTSFRWEMIQMTEDYTGYSFYFQCDESQIVNPGVQMWIIVDDGTGDERAYGVRISENPVELYADLNLEYSPVANPFFFEEAWCGQAFVTLLKDDDEKCTAYFTNEKEVGGYLPLIEQGKIWEYVGYYSRKVDDMNESGLVHHFMKFDGTVTVNDLEYSTFKLYHSDYYRGSELEPAESKDRDDMAFYMREEGKQVYVLTKGESIYSAGGTAPMLEGSVTGEEYSEFLRYDFSLSNGSEFYLPSGAVVAEDELIPVIAVKDEPVTVAGEPCTTYAYYKAESYGTSYWRPAYGGRVIAGVGPTQDGNLAVFGPPYLASLPNDVNGPGQGSELARVYAPDGTLIYGDAAISVERIADESEQDQTIYDVMGRQVKETVPGSVYIRGGKKFVAR